MNRAYLIVSAFLILAAAGMTYDQTTVITCRYFSGCSVEPGCSVHLDRVSCTTENIIPFNVDCWNLSPYCVTECSCHCNNSSVNYGYSGVIDYYNTCRESYVQSKYECNNCGQPYPSPTPTPTPTPEPTPTPTPDCQNFGYSCGTAPCCDPFWCSWSTARRWCVRPRALRA